MKTFLMNIPAVIRNFKNTMDVKALLCDDKSWIVFNDENRKIVFIFQRDNSLIISDNGEVSYASWQYVNANGSLIIKFDRQSFMYHPTFVDNILFALEQDGCERYMMMINEAENSRFKELTANALNEYLAEKERLYIEEHKDEIEAKRKKERQEKILAWEKVRRIEILEECREEFMVEKEAYRRKRKFLSYILMGVAACCLIGGIVMLILDHKYGLIRQVVFLPPLLLTVGPALFLGACFVRAYLRQDVEEFQETLIYNKLEEEEKNMEF